MKNHILHIIAMLNLSIVWVLFHIIRTDFMRKLFRDSTQWCLHRGIMTDPKLLNQVKESGWKPDYHFFRGKK